MRITGMYILKPPVQVALLLLALATPWAGYGQTTTSGPLDLVLGEVIDQTNLDLAYDPSLVAYRNSTCGGPAGSGMLLLSCILKDTGLELRQLRSGTYTLVESTPAPPSRGEITGRIFDQSSGIPVRDVNVVIQNLQVGTATDESGVFSFTGLPPGPHTVVASHIAYVSETRVEVVEAGRSTQVQVALLPNVSMTAPLVVDATLNQPLSGLLGSGSRDAIDLIRSARTTADPLSSLNQVVGVTTGNALADVHVQGGAAGDHQHRLDGATVFVPIRNGGMFGPFSPYALDRITVHKAGFGAPIGSQLGGVIDIRHKLGRGSPKATVQVDQTSLNGRAEGATKLSDSVNLEWMAAGRMSLWSLLQLSGLQDRFRSWSAPDTLLLKELDRDQAGKLDYARLVSSDPELAFSDVHAAARLKTGSGTLSASFYDGRNTFGNEVLGQLDIIDEVAADKYSWGNRAAQVSYQWIPGRTTLLEVGAWSSRYRMDNPLDATGLPGFEITFVGEQNPSSVDRDDGPAERSNGPAKFDRAGEEQNFHRNRDEDLEDAADGEGDGFVDVNGGSGNRAVKRIKGNSDDSSDMGDPVEEDKGDKGKSEDHRKDREQSETDRTSDQSYSLDSDDSGYRTSSEDRPGQRRARHEKVRGRSGDQAQSPHSNNQPLRGRSGDRHDVHSSPTVGEDDHPEQWKEEKEKAVKDDNGRRGGPHQIVDDADAVSGDAGDEDAGNGNGRGGEKSDADKDTDKDKKDGDIGNNGKGANKDEGAGDESSDGPIEDGEIVLGLGKTETTEGSGSRDERKLSNFNQVREFGFRAGFDAAVSEVHQLKGGIETVYTDSDFRLLLDPIGDGILLTTVDTNPIRWRWQTFLEDVVSVSSRTDITVGSRITYAQGLDGIYLEPRFAATHEIPQSALGAWGFRLATGIYYQFVDQFDIAPYNAAGLIPSYRFWIPVAAGQRPSQAYHVSFSTLYAPAPRWRINFETYYKYHSVLRLIDYGSLAGDSPNGITEGQGYSVGAAVGLAVNLSRARIETKYEWNRSRRSIPNRFDERFVPTPWEAPHTTSLLLDLRVTRNLTLTTRWNGVWGRTWGLRRSYYDYLASRSGSSRYGEFDLSHPEDHKLPAFIQLDLGLAYSLHWDPLWIQARVNFINALSRANVTDWSLVHSQSGTGYELSPRLSTPFLPVFSLSVGN